MSRKYSELSDPEELEEWLEEFEEERTKVLEEYQKQNPNEEFEGDETDASPVGAARGILRKSFNL